MPLQLTTEHEEPTEMVEPKKNYTIEAPKVPEPEHSVEKIAPVRALQGIDELGHEEDWGSLTKGKKKMQQEKSDKEEEKPGPDKEHPLGGLSSDNINIEDKRAPKTDMNFGDSSAVKPPDFGLGDLVSSISDWANKTSWNFEDRNGKKATVEEETDVEDYSWGFGNKQKRKTRERYDDIRPGLSETRQNKSPAPSEHQDNQSHVRRRRITVNHTTGSKKTGFTDEGSLGLQDSSEPAESEDGWDYIEDEIELARDVSSHKSPMPPPSRHRSVSLDSFDDYPGYRVPPPRIQQPHSTIPRPRPRRRESVYSTSSDDYPVYRLPPKVPPITPTEPYEYTANPFAPRPDPYPMPGYAPNLHTPRYGPYENPFVLPSRYNSEHPAYAGMRSRPSVPIAATAPPPPLPPPPPPPPPPPASPPLNGPGSRLSGPAKVVSDGDGQGLPYSSRRIPGFKSWERKERRHPRPTYNKFDHLGTAVFERDQKDSKCHPYNTPFGDYGEPLSIDIQIRGPGKKQPFENNSMGWPDADSGQHHYNGRQTKLLNIVEAKRWFDSESRHTLYLTCSSGPSDEKEMTKNTMRWLHVEKERLDFDDFMTTVLSVPNLSRDWNIVLLSLLKRIQKLHYDHSRDRFFPWTLRADSSELGLPSTGDATLSATAISFPYFALGPLFGHGPRNTDQQYPIMSLFEWDDRFESTKEWDSEQSFRLMNDGSGDNESIIYVPHVWALAFNNTIITYGQVAFNDLVNNQSIKVLELDPKAPGRATSVEVTDLRGCQFALSLNQCRTFFALKQSIKVHCSVNLQGSFDNIDVITPNNQTVNGEKWISLLQEHSSSMIRLQLRQKMLKSTAAATAIATATATSRPASPSESAKAINLGVSDRVSENNKRNVATRPRGDAETGEDDQLESGSESESDLNKRTHNALALIPRSSRSSPKPTFQTNSGLVPYSSTALSLSRPNMPSVPLLTHQEAISNFVSTSAVSSESTQRRRKLEEKGVIVFDTSAIEKSPEIYVPLNNAVVRFRSLHGDTDAIPENSSVDIKPHKRSPKNAKACEVEDDEQADTTESNELDKQSRITIPHFLSWATSQEHVMQESLSQSSIESIVKILRTVHEALQTVKPSRHGRTYRRSREIAQIDLEADFPSLQARKSVQTPQTSLSARGNEETEKQHPIFIGSTPQNDRIRAGLFEACNTTLAQLYTVLNGFLSLYVPLSSPSVSDHPLVQKCWGALETIMVTITSGVRNEPQDLKYKDPEWWIIRNPSALNMLSNRKKPVVSWKECEACRNSTQYRTRREAMQHVQLHHFGVPGNDDGIPDETLALWLRNDTQYYADHRLELYTHYMGLIVDPLREVYNKGRGIWDGVASDNSSMSSRFMLPKSLVNAFENVVLLLICAAKSFPIINRCSDPMNQHFTDGISNNIKKDRDLLETTGKDLFHIGNCAKEFMNNAERDIMLMAYTDIDTETVSYNSVGPEYILATIMTSLFNRPLHADKPIDLVYTDFYRRLHRDAMKHPRTQVFRKIWRIHEELGLVASINIQQEELLTNYLRILEPCTFRATTFIRAVRFRVEAPFIDAQLRKAHSVRLRVSDLDSRLEDVSSHVSRMLEIQQENNGKAIIVFTIVTIIFLPLSWATSYLGMNTSDIRDLSQGQWLFWLIALPVTTVVIGFAMLALLKGETIREFFIQREAVKEQQRSVSTGLFAKRRLSTRMTEASIGRNQSTMMSDNYLWRGFRRRTTIVRGDGEV